MKLRSIAAWLVLTIIATSLPFFSASAEVQSTVPEYIELSFVEYEDGIVNGRNSAVLERVELKGRTAMKATPNPECVTATNISLDGYSYSSAGIDLEQYTWVGVEYLYESENPLTSVRGGITLYNGGGNSLSTSLSVQSSSYVTANKWDIALYNISDVKNYLNPDAENHILYQMHIRPLGSNNLSKLSSEDAIYVSKVYFFRSKPVFEYRSAYFDGYEDGTYRPTSFLTRAEACALVARLTETDSLISGTPTFKDADPNEWYARFVGYLEEKGMLDFFGSQLRPNDHITKEDFTRLCVGSEFSGSSPESASSFGSIPSSESSPISRGEAAAVLNMIAGIPINPVGIPERVQIAFTDIDETSPYYADMASACFDHALKPDGTWFFACQDPLLIYIDRVGVDALYDTEAGDAKVLELDGIERARIGEIRNYYNELSEIDGKYYYVSSSSGNDNNSGLSSESPKKTIAAANALAVSGDAVLMQRGDTWRERITTKSGVTYSAYGNGDKPKIYGSPENGAGSGKWTLVEENPETGALIWKYYREDFVDVGTIIFNDGEGYAMKEIPSCVGADYYVRGQESLPVEERTPYDYKVELDNNLEFFHSANSATSQSSASGEYINVESAVGPLYLRCDNGNPGKVFSSIEFNTRGTIIAAKNNVTIDNLCIMYGGSHGIGAGTIKGLTVTNCEIGWIGGSIQGYTANGSTKRTATRFGNGVEVYGGCDGYIIDNCYIYQCYDAGVTHQYSDLSQGNCVMLNVTYSDNVITDCVYSIEYFLGTAEGYDRRGDNILFEGNLLRRAGFGFGSFRPDGKNQRHIRSSSRDNPFTNYRIINNVFDRSVHQLIYANTPYAECVPTMQGNTFIQGVGNNFYHVGTKSASTDFYAYDNVKTILGDTEGEMYFVDYIPYYEYNYTPSKTVAVTSSDRA